VESGHANVKHAEVALSRTAKLVLIAKAGMVFLRLRCLIDGNWKFLTPPLELPADDVERLIGELDDAKGYPSKFRDQKSGAELNLLLYRGIAYLDFKGEPFSASRHDLSQALRSLNHHTQSTET